jgi:hypothetical protein
MALEFDPPARRAILPTSGGVERGGAVAAVSVSGAIASAAPPANVVLGREGASVVPSNPRNVTAGIQVSPVGWTAAPGMGRRRWDEYGRRIARAGNGTNWWLGDWLQFGIREYGDKYAVASRITGYDEQTLMNYVYVSAHVSIRARRAEVSWSHHAELAKLGEAEQVMWLQRVADEAISVLELRRRLRTSLARAEAPVRSHESAPGVCPTCGRPLDS